MPPVRTNKKNKVTSNTVPLARSGLTSTAEATDASKTVAKPSGKVTKPAEKVPKIRPYKGDKQAEFISSIRDWDGAYLQKIGTATRDVILRYEFVLTDKHINDIVAMGQEVCHGLKSFIFNYSDVSYDAKNDADSLTDAAVVAFAQACPNLTKVQIQGIYKQGNDSVIAFFEHCPKLKHLEITGKSDNVNARVFDVIVQNPAWAPQMKQLLLTDKNDEKAYMKAMRELSRARPTLMIKLASIHENKKWGDWELDRYDVMYKKGRKTERRLF